MVHLPIRASCSGVLESILPLANKLLKDPSTVVRCSLAISLVELLSLFVGLGSQGGDESLPNTNGGDDSRGIRKDGYKRHKRHIDETLIPLVHRLLHDAGPEVTSATLRAVSNASRRNARDINTKQKKDFSSASASTTTAPRTLLTELQLPKRIRYLFPSCQNRRFYASCQTCPI